MIAAAATGAWLVLNRWYSISGHWDIPAFAFDKVRGDQGEPALSPSLRWTAAIFIALGIAYFAGWVLIAKARRLGILGKAAILLAGLGPGAINVSLFPVGALDVFRYMRALRQFLHFHENPFTQGFAAHADDPFAAHRFLLTLPNAKGPAWLLLSSLPAKPWIDDPVDTLVALKLFNLLLLALTSLLVARLVRSPERRWLAGYAVWANPLVLFEGVGNVHNDVMTALFVVGALAAFRRGSWLTGPLLTLSLLVKYFTPQLFPLFAVTALARRWRPRTIALAVLTSAAVVAACVAPFWEGGEMLDGIDAVGDTYNRSSHVSLISLVRQYRIEGLSQADTRGVTSHQPLFAIAFAVIALPMLWRARHGEEERLLDAAIDLTLLFFLLLTLLYPWYLLTVMPLLVLRARPLGMAYLFTATLLGLLLYVASVWAWHGSGYPRLERHLFLSLFITLPILSYFAARFGVWLLKRSRREPRSI